jgi:competence protein ComEC
MKFSSIPFLRILLFFGLGIALNIYFEINTKLVSFFLVVAGLFFSALCLSFSDKLKVKYKPLLGFLAIATIFLFGIFLVNQSHPYKSELHITKIDSPIQNYVAIINSEVEEKQKTYKAELKLIHIKTNGKWQNAEGKILAYFYKDSTIKKLNYGSKILIADKPNTIERPLNPYQFDLKKYYFFHGISHRHFLKNSSFQVVGFEPQNQLMAFAISSRQFINQIFIDFLIDPRERNIAAALVLGIKNPLDTEILNAYAVTGTMHVLAVSGLHVGFVYGILIWLTSFLTKFKYGKHLQSIFLLAILWFYALITGLCPSILRAVTMLTLVIVSTFLNRQNNIFQSLFVAAFLLLAINPYLITEVGFQLSFLAVLGILFFEPKISSLWNFENKILSYVWSITSISIAAQITTFPLGVLYFHQFPNYFLLSNLIVIPITEGIMSLGFVFLFSNLSVDVAKFMGFLLEYGVYWLNQLIFMLEKLPYSSLQGVGISVLETYFIYWLIFSLAAFLVLKQFKWIVVSFVVLCILCTYQIIEKYKFSNQENLIVYQVNKSTAIDFTNGFEFAFWADSQLLENKSQIKFNISNFRINKQLKEHNPKIIKSKKFDWGELVVWKTKKILILKKPIQFENKRQFDIDYLLISHQAIKDLNEINANIKFVKLIIDGSSGDFWSKNIKKQALELGIEIYDTKEKGAFLVHS